MWELGVLDWFDSLHGTFLDQLMVGVTYSATSGLVWFVLGFLMTCSRRWRRCGVSVIVSVALAYVVVDVILKPLVCRDRPFTVEDFDLLVAPPDTWSFPSGHTASAFAGAVAILVHDRRWGSIALVYAALVGISRMYLCVHWLTDVIAGAVIGAAVAVLAIWFMSRWVPYFRGLEREGAILRCYRCYKHNKDNISEFIYSFGHLHAGGRRAAVEAPSSPSRRRYRMPEEEKKAEETVDPMEIFRDHLPEPGSGASLFDDWNEMAPDFLDQCSVPDRSVKKGGRGSAEKR